MKRFSCKACYNERHGIKTRRMVEHTCERIAFFIPAKKDLTKAQSAYINWLDFPPKFYCKKYSNAESPPENSKGWYCTNQCFDCMAIVGETRIKNKGTI